MNGLPSAECGGDKEIDTAVESKHSGQEEKSRTCSSLEKHHIRLFQVIQQN